MSSGHLPRHRIPVSRRIDPPLHSRLGKSVLDWHGLPAWQSLSPLTAVVICILIVGAMNVAAESIAGLLAFKDVGYPDSANLLRIGDVVQSGQIYPEFERPPYLVTIYGPVMYAVYALPYALAEFAGLDARVAVRFTVLGAYSCGLALIFLLGRLLYAATSVAWLSVLFALSVSPMAAWTTQIRGDFLAIAFSLSSLYVALVSNGRWPFIVAALLAGLAILVKQTYVTAPLAIFVWLVLYKRRSGSAVLWSLVVGLTVVAGYAVAWWREPLVLRHLEALSSPIFEYRGALSVLRTALSQTLVPFAVVGAFLALRRGNAGTALLATFVIASWFVAVGTVLQIGGSINYFFEPLMASAILAGRGLVEVARAANQAPLAARAWLVVLLVWACSPIIVQDLAYLREAYRTALSYEGRKARWSSFAAVVTGHRLLSTVPSVTALGRSPEVPDPYLNTALELRGKWSSAPVVADLEAARYDLVCLYRGQADEATGFRGADAWSDDILSAFRKAYEFACVFDDMEIWLPRQSDGALRSRLAGAGCDGGL